MIEFRQALQNKLLDLTKDWVGPTALVTERVISFDSYLHDVEIDDTPFIVVNVRRTSKQAEGEIGNAYDLFLWETHIYYIDMDKDYATGEAKRDKILGKIEAQLEENRRLDNLANIDGTGRREYVYDHQITDVLFDYSGQDEYHSFTAELYIEVFTDRTKN